ncbi:carbohydrate/purine kinase [Diaporthe sp. PMI_573]|nr:carbohydrate/purine kinase [Diaporthaceae sp. PMI_573]
MAPNFVSLGMVVLDELRFPHAPPMHDVTGGSGAFSTLGARLVAGKERSHEVGCVIMAGDDFPESSLAQFRSWGMDLLVPRKLGRLSTRGLLIYEDKLFGKKTFQYTTERLQPTPSDLASSSLLGSSAFHLLASPDLAREQIQQLLSLRQSNGIEARPLLVWEPLPGSCKSNLRGEHIAAAKLVDVYSPNHLEFLALFGDSEPSSGDLRLDRRSVERYAESLLDSGVGPDGRGAVIVRAGMDGCLVSSSSIPERHYWLPPFYDDDDAVVDATGAGNTFLGALTFAISARRYSVVEASALASVAASFSLQQIGLPSLSSSSENGSQERWNGDTFTRRCGVYELKIAFERTLK